MSKVKGCLSLGMDEMLLYASVSFAVMFVCGVPAMLLGPLCKCGSCALHTDNRDILYRTGSLLWSSLQAGMFGGDVNGA